MQRAQTFVVGRAGTRDSKRWKRQLVTPMPVLSFGAYTSSRPTVPSVAPATTCAQRSRSQQPDDPWPHHLHWQRGATVGFDPGLGSGSRSFILRRGKLVRDGVCSAHRAGWSESQWCDALLRA